MTVDRASDRDDLGPAAELEPRGDPAAPIRRSLEAGLAVLRGNLAPDGAVIKPSAASPALLRTPGRRLVFDTIEDCKARIDDPELDVTPDDVLVLRGCGPRGYPGMPEVGNMPLPAKILPKACSTWSGSATPA